MHSEYQSSLLLPAVRSARPGARPLLEQIGAQVGFLVSMYAVVANSPELLAASLDGYERSRKASSFAPAEEELILRTISRETGSAHPDAPTAPLPEILPAVTEDIREDHSILDAKLNALSRFTKAILRSRGNSLERDMDHFLAAGYGERHVLEILLAIAMKTLGNRADH